MAKIRLESLVAAAAERVFDLARDLGFHQRSLIPTRERIVGGRNTGLIEVHEEVEWEAWHLGLLRRLRSRITAMDRPRAFIDVQVRGPFQAFTHGHRFEPEGPGTRMIDEWTHEAPFGPMGSLADFLFLARPMRRLLEIRNASLKAEAEGS